MAKQELDMDEGKGIRTAVDVMILNQQKNQILLGLRKSKAGENTWGFPGGHQKTGEKIAETAKRELKEELGDGASVLISNLIVAVRENMVPPWYVPHLTVILEGTYTMGEIVVTEPDKTIEWRWFEIDELPKDLFSGVGEVIENYRQHNVLVVTDWQTD